MKIDRFQMMRRSVLGLVLAPMLAMLPTASAQVSAADQAAALSGKPGDPAPQPATATQASLGLTVQPATPEVASRHHVSGAVTVGEIARGSFAEGVGLSAGMVITEINRKKVTSLASYRSVVATLKPGDDVVFVVYGSGPSAGMNFLGGTLPAGNGFKPAADGPSTMASASGDRSSPAQTARSQYASYPVSSLAATVPGKLLETDMHRRSARAQSSSLPAHKPATASTAASQRVLPDTRTLQQTMHFIQSNTPVDKPLSGTMFYPKGNLPYTATLSAFAVNACSTDSKLQVNWGGAVLNREPHLELGKIDPRHVVIVTSDAYRKQIVSSQGGEDIVSVTAPVNYFVGIPKEIALSAGQTVKDLQIFAFTDDKEMAEGLARAYIHAISLCGHKPGAAPASGHGAAASPTAREIERQALTALADQEKDAETETARDAETYSTQVKVAQEKAAAEKAVRDAALAKAEQAVQAARAAQAERLRQWQAKVDGLTEQVRIAEQDAVDKEQIAGQADQLKQQADGLTDTSAANSGSMGTAGVLMGSLGSLWGSHTAKKNRDAAQKARAHANEMRAQLDAMGASQPPPVTESSLPPITPADTTNPIQDELNKGLNNINAAYAHDMALKQQQEQQQAQQQSQQSSSAAITSTSTSSEEDYCKGHHPVYHGCRGAISDAVARDNYCYCP